MRLSERKIVASFEIFIMMASLFAFSYLISESDTLFNELHEVGFQEGNFISKLAGAIFGKLTEPIIPLVSAEQINTTLEGGSILTEDSSKTVFSISSNEFGAGCCALTTGGEKCATATVDYCSESAPFAEGALCTSTSFCRKGCCYSEDEGIYDNNVLKSDCPTKWVADPNCNMPSAKLGCCILGTNSIFETEGQCKVDTLSRALGFDAVVNWDGEINEAQCSMLSIMQVEGACVSSGGMCKFGNEADCLSYGGQFNEDYLCTSASLNTLCEITEETTCVDGRDGVYFLDSCGNYANIYDSSKFNDVSYWDKVISSEDSCGTSNTGSGNANSKSCGNCNRFLGGSCASASENNFGVDAGEFYCKSSSCIFEGESYRNGESWCVYDGKIGDGEDVVGSRHWKYVCSQGDVRVEPCADYRNQICIQTNTFDFEEKEVQFKNAACIANNWRECINLNGQEDGLELCEETLNCRIEKVEITDKFNFNVCTPKYPGGFSFKDERYQKTAKQVCGMADQKCTVVYRAKKWGGCELVANGGCLGEKFAQEMNSLCTSLGDCGGAVNVEGVYSENYRVGNSPKLSESWISGLKALAKPVPGQFAEVENYDKYLEAAGLLGSPAVVDGDTGGVDTTGVMNGIGMGALGVAYAAGAYATGSFSFTGIITLLGESAKGFIGPAQSGAGFAAFSGVALGAGVGMIAGAMLASSLGLSSGGSLLMSIGAGILGATIAGIMMDLAWMSTLGPIGLIIGVILIIISLFFGGDDCDPVIVTFECKPWQPVVGGDDCESCNGNILKPCSDYRCSSLGASCELINRGSTQELCIDGGRDDTFPPQISPQLETISKEGKYGDVYNKGFSITALQEKCLDAYSSLVFGITTDEPAQCRFDFEKKEFENMAFDFGGNYYSYNHTTNFMLPDPSHGQSQGGNWTGDLTAYIKCRDTKGQESVDFYTVDICVNEGPDRTPPIIRAISPVEGTLVNFDSTSENLTVITNEPATCKWDNVDVDYDLMVNFMTCNDVLKSPSSPLGYVCSSEVPITESENTYYIRCMDQPWLEGIEERNANTQSYTYTIRKPEKKIEIDWIEPSENFNVFSEMTTIELQVQTSGGGEWHFCSYSLSGYENMIEMFETGSNKIHIQQLNRPFGKNKIYVECSDETGDSVQSLTEFKIIYDTAAPQVARVWQEGSILYIGTTEDSECIYSEDGCDYAWDEGTLIGSGTIHTISVIAGKMYFIKCNDETGNAPSGCSIIVQVA